MQYADGNETNRKKEVNRMKNLTIETLTAICKDMKSRNQTWTQLGKKSFWYSDWNYLEVNGMDLYIRALRSYSTIVGFEISNLKEYVLYEIGKYSTTTSRQITQYFNGISFATERIFIKPDINYQMIS